jgi:hypothetical protein
MDGRAFLARWLAFHLANEFLVRLKLSRISTISRLRSHDSFPSPTHGPFGCPCPFSGCIDHCAIPVPVGGGCFEIAHSLATDIYLQI